MNKAAFFARVRASLFGGKLSQKQVQGMDFLIDYRAANWPEMPDAEFAYVLATVKLETAHTMQPVKEYGGRAYFMRMYDITGRRPHVARSLGNIHKGDGAKYAGRGYVQITGRDNYRKYGLVDNPDKALEPQTAARILFDGMIKGTFTGKKLADYINDRTADYVGARRIINGTNKARLIAGYAENFAEALREAKAAEPEVEPEGPTPEAETTGKPAAKSTTIWAAILQLLSGGGLAFLNGIDWRVAIVLGVVVVASLWIIRERLLKSKNEGV